MTYFKLQNTTKSICLCVLFTFLFFVSFSQSTRIDSLSGFNQSDVAIMAHQNGYYGSETKVFIDMMKRNFINQKFNLNRSPSINLIQGKYHPATIASAPSIDEDIEGLTAGNLVSTS